MFAARAEGEDGDIGLLGVCPGDFPEDDGSDFRKQSATDASGCAPLLSYNHLENAGGASILSSFAVTPRCYMIHSSELLLSKEDGSVKNAQSKDDPLTKRAIPIQYKRNNMHG